MPCKSVFLLQIKYIEKFKLSWQLKIGGGGGNYITMLWKEAEQGGNPPKTIFKKSWKKSKTKIKKSTRNLKVGACGLTFIIMIQTIF